MAIGVKLKKYLLNRIISRKIQCPITVQQYLKQSKVITTYKLNKNYRVTVDINYLLLYKEVKDVRLT